jgi:MFS family permease
MLGYGQPGGAPPPPPPGYGAPPPPPPPGYGGGFESKTEKGVKYFKYSLLLYIIIALLGFVIALIVLSVLPSLVDTDSAGDAFTGAIALAATIILIACVVVILTLLVIIFFILGIINFNSGKREYSPTHTSNVNKGLIFFLLAIIMVFLGIGLSANTGVTVSDVDEYIETARNSALISGVFSLLSGVFMGLMFMFMVKGIAHESDGKLLNIGLIMLIIGGVISMALVFIMFPTEVGDVSDADAITIASTAGYVGYLGGIVSFIGYIMFFMAYNHTHKALASGQVRPSGGGGPPAPGGYPPPPPPGRYPPPPPPPGRGY